MRLIGAVFAVVAVVLFYIDSFAGVLGPLHALPTFTYFLPRLVDFLFYGGLILITVSVARTKIA